MKRLTLSLLITIFAFLGATQPAMAQVVDPNLFTWRPGGSVYQPVDNYDPSPVLNMCGPRPSRPGYSVGFENFGGVPSAVILGVYWVFIDQYIDDVSNWTACAVTGEFGYDPSPVLNRCGARPIAPGFLVSIENVNGITVAIIPGTHWTKLDQYLVQGHDWTVCAAKG